MTLKAVAAGLGGALAFAVPANASFNDGNQLLNHCTDTNRFAEGMCYGVISGYFEGMQTTYKCSKINDKITREQIKDVVVKFLRENPADRHLPGLLLSYRAFTVAFDCAEKSKLLEPWPR